MPSSNGLQASGVLESGAKNAYLVIGGGFGGFVEGTVE
jgi:hypothetical protein